MPIRNEQQFTDAIGELKNKKSRLNRRKLEKMVGDYIKKNEKYPGAGIKVGQEELNNYLKTKRW